MANLNIINLACEIVRRAIDEDLKYNYGEAVQLYTDALNYFIPSLKCENNERLKRLLREKITEFLDRAETLQDYLPKGTIERRWCETPNTQRKIFEAMEKQRFALILGSRVEHTQGRVNTVRKCVSNINGIKASIASLDLNLDYKL